MTSVEARIKHAKLGWRWYQITIMNLLEDPSICGYLFNLRDITDRKHAELASEAALRRSRRPSPSWSGSIRARPVPLHDQS